MRDILEKLAAELSDLANTLEAESTTAEEQGTQKVASDVDFSMGSVGDTYAAGASDPLLDWILGD